MSRWLKEGSQALLAARHSAEDITPFATEELVEIKKGFHRSSPIGGEYSQCDNSRVETI
jgi:hypothetical protein